jgi:hypothetical protein
LEKTFLKINIDSNAFRGVPGVRFTGTIILALTRLIPNEKLIQCGFVNLGLTLNGKYTTTEIK